MALPVNIHELINGKSIEWERLEFKKGWNPEDIIHSMCAFANDINNWGGGYIILGIEEQNGRPVLPPIGINPDSIDGIQKKLLELYNRIQPYYRPIVAPYVYEGQHILVIWVPAGDMRPYTAPETHGKTAQQRFHYIRVGSVTKKALGEDLRKLQELTARIPHDDRINQDAQLNDLKLSKIQAYLQQINSSLFEECQNMPFADLCRQMNIARGPDENLRPINVGLLFFNDKPHTFFDRAQIEIVIHKDETGRGFIEETFQGPLNKQLTDALFFLKQMVVRKQTIKIQGKAEAQTVYTYPFEALEEVLANAVYHKSYEYNNPIEIQVFPNSIEILSFPGPLPPITQQDLKKYRVTARNYRNRRIGDFLKELKLTEGRGTGFPFIRSNLKRNASPEPEFITDDDKTYFLAILKIHPEFETEEQASFNDIANINNVHDLDSLQSLLDHILTHDLDVKFVVKLADAKLSARANARVHARADEIAGSKANGNRGNDLITSDIEGDIDGKARETNNDKLSDRVNARAEGTATDNKYNALETNDLEGNTSETSNETLSARVDDRVPIGVSARVNDILVKTVRKRDDEKAQDTVKAILKTCVVASKREEVLNAIGLKNHIGNYKRYMLPLIELNWLQKTEKETSPKQRYQSTKKGKILLDLLNELEG